jgi:hypothetical protein
MPPPLPPPATASTSGMPPPRPGIAGIKPPAEPNTVSVYGAPTLGQWKRGQNVFLGFPLLGGKLAIGLHDRVDFGLGFQSFYGVMNEFLAFAKVGIHRGSNWSFSASLEGKWALFQTKASVEQRGPRWITGHRNFGVSPGVILTYQGDHPRSARVFADLRYLLTFDTEPVARDPLNGVPPRLLLGHNVMVHFGAEMPLSARTSFVFLLGMDIHGRGDDSPVMPVCSLGVVAGL